MSDHTNVSGFLSGFAVLWVLLAVAVNPSALAASATHHAITPTTVNHIADWTQPPQSGGSASTTGSSAAEGAPDSVCIGAGITGRIRGLKGAYIIRR